MAEPISSTTAAGVALLKIFGIPVVAGSVAASLGFLYLWPITKKEAFARFASSIISSAVVGPLLVVWVSSYMPTMFDGAKSVAVLCGVDATAGLLFIASPLMVAAGLPAWWILGAIMRWLDRHKDQDIGEMAGDAANAINKVRAEYD